MKSAEHRETPHAEAARVFLGTLSRQAFQQARQIQPCAEEWKRLQGASDPEGLTGLLSEELAHLPGWSEFVRPFRRSQIGRSGLYFDLLRELAEILRSLSCPGLLFKGAALLCSEYKGKLGLRPLGDVDLLVDEQTRVPLQTKLLERGFKQISSSCFGRGEQLVDVHRDVINSDRIPLRAQAYRLTSDSLWARSHPLERALSGLHIPDPIDHLLLLAVHAQKHSHGRLFWLVDIGLLLPRCDSALLWQRAWQTGTQRSLAYACTLLQSLFALPVATPPFPYHWLERQYLLAVTRRRNVSGLGEVLLCLSLPGWLNRLRYLAQLLWPQSESPMGVSRLRVAVRGLWGVLVSRD